MATFKGRWKHMARQHKIHGHDKRSERHRKMAKHEQKIEGIVRELKAQWQEAQQEETPETS